MPFITIGIVVALALSGGVAFEAEQALPGDALYGFKVGVNENVRSAFAVGTQAQADWDIEAANRRLDEAEKLAVAGRLDADAKADIETNFDAKVRAATGAIAKLQAEGKYDAAKEKSAKLEQSITARSRSLAASVSAQAQANVSSLLSTVETRLNEVTALKASVEVGAGAQSSGGASVGGNNGSTGAGTQGTTSVSTGGTLNVNGSGASTSGSGSATGGVNVNVY